MLHPDEVRRQEVERLQRVADQFVRAIESSAVGPPETWPFSHAAVLLLCAIWRRLDAIEEAVLPKKEWGDD